MDISIRYFTLAEAEAFLSELTPLLKGLQNLKKRIDAKLIQWDSAENEGVAQNAALLRGQVEFMANEIETAVERIQSKGVLVKDLDAGLIDFPARLDGKEAYLCWRLGEPRIAFWHSITEGFSGRKPLP